MAAAFPPERTRDQIPTDASLTYGSQQRRRIWTDGPTGTSVAAASSALVTLSSAFTEGLFLNEAIEFEHIIGRLLATDASGELSVVWAAFQLTVGDPQTAITRTLEVPTYPLVISANLGKQTAVGSAGQRIVAVSPLLVLYEELIGFFPASGQRLSINVTLVTEIANADAANPHTVNVAQQYDYRKYGEVKYYG